MARALTEIIVRRTVKETKSDPDSSLINLVDMASELSKGRLKQGFWAVIQTILNDPNSAYYALAREVFSRVDEDRLITFGMNIGYNSCIYGAELIRQNKEKLGHETPWNIALQFADDNCKKHWNQYSDLIDDGEELGVYTWLLFVQDEPYAALDLAKAHPDSAFILFCEHETLTDGVLSTAMDINNLMLVLRYAEGCIAACEKLAEMGFLYSSYYTYSADDLASIAGGELLSVLQELGAVFTVLMADEGCPAEIQELVYQHTIRARTEQKYRTVAIELNRDSCYIDKMILNCTK